MSKTIKHGNSKEIFHAKRKARPEERSMIEYCDNCGDELFDEDLELGICATCANDPGLRQREQELINHLEHYDGLMMGFFEDDEE